MNPGIGSINSTLNPLNRVVMEERTCVGRLHQYTCVEGAVADTASRRDTATKSTVLRIIHEWIFARSMSFGVFKIEQRPKDTYRFCGTWESEGKVSLTVASVFCAFCG
jgi:hypothetical protein